MHSLEIGSDQNGMKSETKERFNPERELKQTLIDVAISERINFGQIAQPGLGFARQQMGIEVYRRPPSSATKRGCLSLQRRAM
jgi:hypothetical protein